MYIEEISVEQFLKLRRIHPVLDVRSPLEFEHGHIPGAINLPLFSDEERKIVGTAYKKESRENAIKIGLAYFGPKMVGMIDTVEKLIEAGRSVEQGSREKTLLVHCWRGGMRSAGIAWLLNLYGFNIFTLKGGYKVFRRWVMYMFEKSYPFKVIGGYTGSGKTEILRALKDVGEKIIDLEALACHKGSAFGCLGEEKQPSQEIFENKLAIALDEIPADVSRIWIEDESRRIGNLNIPPALYNCKASVPVYFMDIPFDQRLNYIMDGYGKFDKTDLVDATMRIKKRLGPNETKTAVNHLLEGDLENGFAVLLKYYDKQYAKTIAPREKNDPVPVVRMNAATVDATGNAGIILHTIENKSVNQLHGY